MPAFLVTSESRSFALFAAPCQPSPSPSPSLPPSLSTCRLMWIRSEPDSSISPSPSRGWRPPGIVETVRIGAGQIISSCGVPAVWLVGGHSRDGELLLLAAALNVVNGGSHAEGKLATENDDGPQKIFEDALKDPCCMFFGSEHRAVSIVVASFYLNIPKDGLKVMCKSFGSDHPAVLIKDPYPKIAGDALKVTCKSLVSDYPVVLIVDPFNPKISGDAIEVMLEQKIFETFKDRYSKFVGIEFPIISNGDPFKLWKQKISEAPEEKSDGIKFPFISKWEASEEKSDGITFLFISKWDPLELWKQMISEAPEEKSDGIKFPFISKGEPFKLLKILEIFKEIFETLRDRYLDFAGSEFPIISIGDPFNPKIFGDAFRVMCKSFGSRYPVVSIEDSFYSKISGDALKDYKSFVSKYPIVSILEMQPRSKELIYWSPIPRGTWVRCCIWRSELPHACS